MQKYAVIDTTVHMQQESPEEKSILLLNYLTLLQSLLVHDKCSNIKNFKP